MIHILGSEYAIEWLDEYIIGGLSRFAKVQLDIVGMDRGYISLELN